MEDYRPTHPKIIQLNNIPQNVQKSQAWLDQRKKYLTSSDSATPLNMNSYETPEQLLFKKCNAGKPFTGNIATKWGEKYEDEAVEKYCQAMGMKQHEFGLIPFESVPREADEIVYEGSSYLAGSPDGIALPLEDLENGEPVLLEVKCPYRRKIIMGHCPKHYYPQVQLNMYICGLKKAAFIEYKPSINGSQMELNIVEFQINHNWIKKHVPTIKTFWETVIHYRNIGIENHPQYSKRAWTEEKEKAAQERAAKKEVKKEVCWLGDDDD